MKHNSLLGSMVGFILILFLAGSCKKETVEIASPEWGFNDNAYVATFQMQGKILAVRIVNGDHVQQLSGAPIDCQFPDRQFPGMLWVNIDGSKAVVSYSNVFHESPGKLHVLIDVIE